ncbi:uncharacterized protein NECHADRAFT_88549 [Fusarium vanettenii 77-13-4]|uniref:Actin-like ATPase domain-containing protein n=1 Tax=Fusarium vanettenii (strain ATCC MYA-4622 / CBS 123669 / FGSC 9596 / NRRL 45880 / 77-13-4) TaxID=660122 RepID=C7ZBU3_FUSV7|nr:uncharacterized protein NECHADRAFT_88549 [Fusarium vanettenii 77-13-4]EEU38428.1 hypothetical protein NECHADRAFT_88549 [Fusarium vanettenii 77-13-4]
MPSSLSSEIVVGIDFGTTQKKIRLITDWPNPAATIANADKVPTIISYQNGGVANWGYEVGLKEDAFRWIKILLEPKSKYADEELHVQGSSNLLGKVNKTVEEVVSDYLRLIWTYTKENIRKRVGDSDWENNFTLQVVLTVPAMWTPAAKDKTLKAAQRAGLPQDIRLVTEPEAAALSTLHDKAEENSLKKGDAFVVCDAGGGTVDLISYKVNNTSPLEIEECAIGDGDLCGSTRLDKCFEKYIETLVGKDQYSKLKEINKKKMMRVFEYGVKRCFTLESTKEYSVDLKGVEDNERHGIEDDTITLDHYGVCVNQPFDSSRHLWEDRYLNLATNTYYAANQMKWLLRRDKEPPSRYNRNLKQLCSVHYSVEEAKIWNEPSYKSDAKPGKWRDMKMELILILGNATLDFRVKYRDEFVAAVEAEYMQDFS